MKSRKNKGKMKGSTRSAAQKLVDQLQAFAKEWSEKHNNLVKTVNELGQAQQNIAKAAATEIGKLMANHQMVTNSVATSVDQLDLNVLAMARILKEIFGHLVQADHFFRKIDPNLNIDDAETETLKAEAQKWLEDVTSEAFRQVQEERAAEEEKRKAEAQMAKEEAEKAARAKAEAEKMEAELRAADSSDKGRQIGGGGGGVEIPEGADVFGG